MLLRAAAVVLVLALAGCAPRVGEPPPEQVRAETALATVLAVAASPEADLAALAPLVVAQGGDAARRWRASSNQGNPAEAAAAQALADRLQALLQAVRTNGRFGYTVEEFIVEPSVEGPWHVLRFRFDDPDQTEAEAAFLPVGEGLLLGRLER